VKSIRMMGQQIGQRSSLTVNHGTYYVDTTVGAATQCSPTDVATCLSGAKESAGRAITGVNVFKANEVYYLLLIFAKEDTEQTYQIYVGPVPAKKNGEDPLDPISYLNLKLGQAEIKTVPIGFSNFARLPAGRAKWLNDKQDTGVVEITIAAKDLPGLGGLVTQARRNKCRPATFCQSSTDGNACNGVPGVGLDEVCRWAIADLDCPAGGCVSIQWTMPSTFKTDPTPNPRPAPTCVKKTAPWDVILQDPVPGDPTKSKQIAGDCYRSPVTQNFCR